MEKKMTDEKIVLPGVPSVGRIVLFYTPDKSKHSNGIGNGPYPAIITQVVSAEQNIVNLKIFPPFKAPMDDGSVPLYDSVSSPERCWKWPPRV
jgi:hypothetical protein